MTHDPGGKNLWRVPEGIICRAAISEDGKHRVLLSREWDDPDRYALWVGMNPSTADAEFDDPTVRKEWQITRRLGYGAYHKANCMSYRATRPADLLRPGVEASSTHNVTAVIGMAERAALVVAAWGKPPKRVMFHINVMAAALRASGVDLWCLGTNADGSPRHPLFLPLDTPLVRWRS